MQSSRKIGRPRDDGGYPWSLDNWIKGEKMNTNGQIEVRNRVREAIDFYKAAGKEETLREIGKIDGQFSVNGTYLFAVDLEGKMLAHPTKKQLMGRNLIELRDTYGKSFIRRIVDIAKTRGYGFTEYEWPLPSDGKDCRKTTFFEKVDDVVLCCGFHGSKDSSYESVFDRLFGPLE